MFILTFIKDSFQEFKRIKWPSLEELERLLLLFFISFTVCAALIFSTDYLLHKTQQAVYDWVQTKATS